MTAVMPGRMAALAAGAAIALFVCEAARAELAAEETAILARVEANADAALALLERTVNINSGTMNKAGVRAVGDLFAAGFRDLGFATRWEDFPAEVNRAGHLWATRDGARGLKLLLIGHLDTVFEQDAALQTFRREGDIAFGPGVADMKGGDVVVLYALKALHEAGALDGAAIEVVFTGDEEFTGKPIEVSRGSLIAAAQRADVALNFEGGEPGEAVTSRRGSSSWVLTTTGRRRHSSRVFSEDVGAGAAFEAARILTAFYDRLHRQRYLTFSPGVILAGTEVAYDREANAGTAFGKTNVVAQTAVVDGDLRFISEAQKMKARETMRRIIAKSLPQTSAEIEFIDSYPAMAPTPGNAALLKVYSGVTQDLGFGPVRGNDPATRGAADISFAAPHVKASMDGLGVVGDGAHTLEERMEVASLKEATARAAILIYRLTRADAPKF